MDLDQSNMIIEGINRLSEAKISPKAIKKVAMLFKDTTR